MNSVILKSRREPHGPAFTPPDLTSAFLEIDGSQYGSDELEKFLLVSGSAYETARRYARGRAIVSIRVAAPSAVPET
jgi:hypothetical protein